MLTESPFAAEPFPVNPDASVDRIIGGTRMELLGMGMDLDEKDLSVLPEGERAAVPALPMGQQEPELPPVPARELFPLPLAPTKELSEPVALEELPAPSRIHRFLSSSSRPMLAAALLPILFLTPLAFTRSTAAPDVFPLHEAAQQEMMISYLPHQMPQAQGSASSVSRAISSESESQSSSAATFSRPSHRDTSRVPVGASKEEDKPQSRILQRIFERTGHTSFSAASVPMGASRGQMLRATGVYLTSGSVGRQEFFEETLQKLGEAGGNAVIFDVKGSAVYFHSTAELATKYDLVRPLYDLPEIIRIAHEKGFYVMGRLIAVKDDGITSRAPETLVRHPVSNVVLSQGWVDPSNATALQYNREIICDLARAGIDEINMDYIRFSTANFGALGVWSGEEKADKVWEFVKMAREAVDECGPATKLGISAYAILGWNYPVNLRTLGQDVVRFAPLLDVISPMAYPATFTSPEYYIPGKNPGPRMYWLVYRTLTGYQELLGPEESQKLRPWIQGYSVTAQDVRDEMRAVKDAGVCGFTVWNAGNNYGQTYAALSSWEAPEACGAL